MLKILFHISIEALPRKKPRFPQTCKVYIYAKFIDKIVHHNPCFYSHFIIIYLIIEEAK